MFAPCLFCPMFAFYITCVFWSVQLRDLLSFPHRHCGEQLPPAKKVIKSLLLIMITTMLLIVMTNMVLLMLTNMVLLMMTTMVFLLMMGFCQIFHCLFLQIFLLCGVSISCIQSEKNTSAAVVASNLPKNPEKYSAFHGSFIL